MDGSGSEYFGMSAESIQKLILAGYLHFTFVTFKQIYFKLLFLK